MDATRLTSRRAVLNARGIAAAPQAITLRRAGVEHGPYTVRIVRGGHRFPRGQESEIAREAFAYITIIGDAGLDIRRNDRVRAPDGSTYLVMLVLPNRNGRTEADALTEQ